MGDRGNYHNRKALTRFMIMTTYKKRRDSANDSSRRRHNLVAHECRFLDLLKVLFSCLNVFLRCLQCS